MLNKLFQGRNGYFLGFLVSYALVAFALYIQARDQLDPCPLCISQRIAFLVLGSLFLLAALHHPGRLGSRIYGGLQILAALAGSGIAMRHIWIQRNPDKVMAECGAGFDYLFEAFPFQKALQLVFKGTGECSALDWTMLGLTIPEWSLVAFLGLAMYAAAVLLVRRA